MSSKTDRGYDEATRTNDGRDQIPQAVVDATEEDTSTDDNPFDDAHSVDDVAATVFPKKRDDGDVNEHDNEAQWSETDV